MNSPSFTFSGPSADNYTLTLHVTDDDGGDATVMVPIRLGVSSSVTLTNANVPAGSQVLAVAFDGAMIDASGLSDQTGFAGVALGSHDTLIGGAGNNVLQGDSGFNSLVGGSGNDTMYATGGDTLVGGTGNGTDLFALIPPPADAPACAHRPGAGRRPAEHAQLRAGRHRRLVQRDADRRAGPEPGHRRQRRIVRGRPAGDRLGGQRLAGGRRRHDAVRRRRQRHPDGQRRLERHPGRRQPGRPRSPPRPAPTSRCSAAAATPPSLAGDRHVDHPVRRQRTDAMLVSTNSTNVT